MFESGTLFVTSADRTLTHATGRDEKTQVNILETRLCSKHYFCLWISFPLEKERMREGRKKAKRESKSETENEREKGKEGERERENFPPPRKYEATSQQCQYFSKMASTFLHFCPHRFLFSDRIQEERGSLDFRLLLPKGNGKWSLHFPSRRITSNFCINFKENQNTFYWHYIYLPITTLLSTIFQFFLHFKL